MSKHNKELLTNAYRPEAKEVNEKKDISDTTEEK